MQIFQIGDPVLGLIFDMDNTLYTNPPYARHQEDVLVRRLAQEWGCLESEGQARVDEFRAAFAQSHDGRQPSLGNTFSALGIPIATSVDWRRQYIQPELFLEPDPQLSRALQRLASKFRLAVVTNNPVEIARRSLSVLGILDSIPVIVGLDSTNVSKPDPAAFRLAATSLDCDPGQLVSIGDRFAVDIEPALGLGMGGILVDGVADIYGLPGFFGVDK